MVEFTTEERLEIAQALADDMGGDSASVGFAPGDAQKIFCQNWDMVKTVLGYLKPLLPAPVGWVIGALITAGNILHGKICPL